MSKQVITLLLIEDDEEDRLLLQKLLARSSTVSYQLIHTGSYESGLHSALLEAHDLCLLDYRLGARTGLEFLREIRKQGYTRPIVLLTGASESDIDIQALQAGADDYISKHHLQAELLDRIIRYAIERKKTEQERERLLCEQIASKELERKKNEFISMVVHELKTPLTSLKGFTQLLSRRMTRGSDPSLNQLVSRIDAQSNKMASLINDLLDVTRIEGGTFQFEEDFFSFDEVVEEIIQDIQLTNGLHTLHREGQAGQTVWGDRKRVGQVITNLLTNAIKHAPEARNIMVRTAVDAHDICFSVQDAGPGIAREKHTQIFAPFYRIEDGVQRNTSGLGLGLFISAEIIRGQRGRIWVESDEGKGATFFFTLPLNPVR
jgi:signal transduction histidine kinase